MKQTDHINNAVILRYCWEDPFGHCLRWIQLIATPGPLNFYFCHTLLSLDYYINLPINFQNYTANVSHCIVQFKKQVMCSDQTHTTSKLTSSYLVFSFKQPIMKNWFCTNFRWIFSDIFRLSPYLHFLSYWPFFLLNTPKWWNYLVQILSLGLRSIPSS